MHSIIRLFLLLPILILTTTTNATFDSDTNDVIVRKPTSCYCALPPSPPASPSDTVPEMHLYLIKPVTVVPSAPLAEWVLGPHTTEVLTKWMSKLGCVIMMIYIVGSGVVSIGLSGLTVGCLLELQPTPTTPSNASLRCVCANDPLRVMSRITWPPNNTSLNCEAHWNFVNYDSLPTSNTAPKEHTNVVGATSAIPEQYNLPSSMGNYSVGQGISTVPIDFGNAADYSPARSSFDLERNAAWDPNDWTSIDWTTIDWTTIDWTTIDWTSIDPNSPNLDAPRDAYQFYNATF